MALATLHASPEALVAAARRAFEDVVMPALGRPLDFTMLAVRKGEDLSRGAGSGQPRLGRRGR